MTPHLDYGDVFLMNLTTKHPIHRKFESDHQQKVFLALSVAIRGMPKEKIFQELSLESLRPLYCYKKVGIFYKVIKDKKCGYLFTLIIIIMSYLFTKK